MIFCSLQKNHARHILIFLSQKSSAQNGARVFLIFLSQKSYPQDAICAKKGRMALMDNFLTVKLFYKQPIELRKSKRITTLFQSRRLKVIPAALPQIF